MFFFCSVNPEMTITLPEYSETDDTKVDGEEKSITYDEHKY